MKNIILLAKFILFIWIGSSFASDNLDIITNLNSINSIACDRTLANCVAFGLLADKNNQFSRVTYSSEDGGKTWGAAVKLQALENNSNYDDELMSGSIACDENATKCIATHFVILNKIANPVVYKTNDGGKTWSSPEILPVKIDKVTLAILKYSSNNINGTYIKISCDTSATNCAIAGGVVSTKVFVPIILSTKNSGNNWQTANELKKAKNSSPSNIIHGTNLLDIFCDETGKECKTVGNTIARNSDFNDYFASLPVIYSSHDGGIKWGGPQIMPTKIKANKSDTLIGISCNPSGQKCTVAGVTFDSGEDRNYIFVFKTTDGGDNWGKKIKLKTQDPKEYPYALTCDVKNNRCIIIGNSLTRKNSLNVIHGIYYISDVKNNWYRHTINEPSNSILDISCNDTFNKCIIAGYKNQKSS